LRNAWFGGHIYDIVRIVNPTKKQGIAYKTASFVLNHVLTKLGHHRNKGVCYPSCEAETNVF
ncbi:hypothetical protein ACTXPD_18055, partial [Vreelandella alkaliphila]|uniref:hypothetical protein n=1 Tax=Vreelandella alkaliphila TaxID=272774 RepID=UPI003FD8E8FB